MRHLIADLMVLFFPLALLAALYLVFWPVAADLRDLTKWERRR